MDAHVHTATDGRAHDARARDDGHANGAIGGRRLVQRSGHGANELAVKQKPDDDAAGQWAF
jgi:hypothetical protein